MTMQGRIRNGVIEITDVYQPDEAEKPRRPMTLRVFGALCAVAVFFGAAWRLWL